MSEVEVTDEFRHDHCSSVVGVALGLSGCDAVVPGEVLNDWKWVVAVCTFLRCSFGGVRPIGMYLARVLEG
jgi:hypothetical protein